MTNEEREERRRELARRTSADHRAHRSHVRRPDARAVHAASWSVVARVTRANDIKVPREVVAALVDAGYDRCEARDVVAGMIRRHGQC